jgi:hypothetical protein
VKVLYLPKQVPEGKVLGTSETLRDGIEIEESNEKMKNISEHVPTHFKPRNDQELGHYLAGLIEGDGHFSSEQQLVISFHKQDIQLAYYVKGTLGYGHVRQVKDKNAVIFVVSSLEGIYKVMNLINGKIKTEYKMNQIKTNILNNPKYFDLVFTDTLNTAFDNH